MSVSVHAISMLYELRALRSRLAARLQAPAELFKDAVEIRETEWMLAMTDNLLNKIERTGEYIGALEEIIDAAVPPEEAGLGKEQR